MPVAEFSSMTQQNIPAPQEAGLPAVLQTLASISRDRKIYIWGTGELGRATAQWLYLSNISFDGFTGSTAPEANFPYKHWIFAEGLQKTDFFIVASSFAGEIIPQIKKVNPEAVLNRDYVIIPVPSLQKFPGRETYEDIRASYCSARPSVPLIDDDTYARLWKKFSFMPRSDHRIDSPRFWTFVLNIKQVLSENVKGDFAELGVFQGHSAAVMAELTRQTGRQLYLFDTFMGFDARDIVGDDAKFQVGGFGDKSITEEAFLNAVKDQVGREHTHCHYVKGYFPESVEAVHKKSRFAAVSLDCDLYKPMKAGLEFFYPRLSKGGIFIIHDYNSDTLKCKRAVDEFCRAKREHLIVAPDRHGTVVIRKSR